MAATGEPGEGSREPAHAGRPAQPGPGGRRGRLVSMGLFVALLVALGLWVDYRRLHPPEPALQPVVVELFAADNDPATAAWIQTRRQEWQTAFPQAVTVRVLNPDDAANYARLTAWETAAGLKAFAAVEAFVYPLPSTPLAADGGAAPESWPTPDKLHPLALVGREAITRHGTAVLRSLVAPRKGLLSATKPALLLAAAQQLLAADGHDLALPRNFPAADGAGLDPAAVGVVRRWKLTWPPGDEPPPAAELVLLFLPVECPVCADTELLALVVGGRLTGLTAIRPIERGGEPIPAAATQFLQQFVSQPLDGGLEQRLTKVDSIAGATKTVTNVKILLGTLDRAEQLPEKAP